MSHITREGRFVTTFWKGTFTAGLCLLLFPVLAAAQENVGLNGLLPFESPERIGQIQISTLPVTLQPAGQKLKDGLADLYTFETPSLKEQQQILDGIETALVELYSSLDDVETDAQLETLVELEGNVKRRFDLLSAVLHTLQNAPEDQQEALRTELKSLVDAIEGYEADALEGNSNLAVREQLANLNEMTDASAIESVIRIHYYNFNIRTFVSEPFAEYAFNECRRECGPVCDFILGARVRGTQRTSSGVSIDFIPSDSEAKFSININGNTKSNTRGVTDQATVYTYGNHYFSGKKVIKYDGQNFSWYRATLGVNTNNTVMDAKLNRRGLVAKLIGDKIAYNRAVDMNPKSESIAAGRLRGRVLPKFNREIEDTFGDLNDERVKRHERMEAEAIAPNESLARTDHDELRTAERLMNPGQLGADRSTTLFNTSTGMTLQLHESWINNSLARDTLNPPSDVLTFPQFGEMLTAKFERAFDFEVERDEAEEDADKLVVYDSDPLHVKFENGKIRLILRVGLEQAGRDDVIKERRVEVPLKIVMGEEDIQLAISDDELDRVRVLPLDPSDKRPIANRIIGDKIKNKVAERLAEQTFDRHLIYEADDEGKQIPVTIAEVHPVNGWLIVVVEPTSVYEDEVEATVVSEEAEIIIGDEEVEVTPAE